MPIADVPGASQRVVARSRVRITPKYTLEIRIYDFDGVYPIEVIWDPYLPSPTKQKLLARKVDAALAPHYAKLLELVGLLEGGTA